MALLLCVFCLEIFSYLYLKSKIYGYPKNGKYNIELSLYSVFEASPYYISETQDSESPYVISDKYGFISNDSTLYDDDSIFRVFILGGSSMYGSGQVNKFAEAGKYDDRVFSYKQSIAGNLLNLLQKEYPTLKFQVVNAAFFGKNILQNYMLYIQRIRHLNPNLIISLDGKNDILNLVSGVDVYEATTQIWKERMIYMYNHNKRFSSNFLNLLYLNLIVNRKKLNLENKYLFKYNDTKIDEYKILKPQFEENIKNTNQIINDFQKAVISDNVKMIFGIQPLLARDKKCMSNTESKIINNINLFYDKNTVSELPVSDFWKKIFKTDTLYKEPTYFYKYFFDDYLSSSWDSISKKNKVAFIDFEKETQNLSASFGLYTDDCHLTRFGNLLVANKLFETIINYNLIYSE